MPNDQRGGGILMLSDIPPGSLLVIGHWGLVIPPHRGGWPLAAPRRPATMIPLTPTRPAAIMLHFIDVHERAVMAKYCIGIDLGGTFIKFVLVDAAGTPTETFQLPTPENVDGVVDQMVAGGRQALETHGVAAEDAVGVGIGSPGPLDIDKGIVINTPNIEGMTNVPLRDRVSEGIGMLAVLENDANAAAYGEFIAGAGREARNMALLTLGTGVGGGAIVDGKLLHGSHGMGAEMGHMIVQPGGRPCGCGQVGCLEQYGSATFIARHAMRLIQEEGRTSSLADVIAAKGEIDAKDINEARRAGDELAAEVWDEAAHYLAMGCLSLARIFDPDMIVLGGGMTNAGDDLMTPLKKHFSDLHWNMTPIVTDITVAALGNDAGAIGSAGVAWAAFGNGPV